MKAQQGTRLLVGLDEEKSLRLQPGFFDRDVVLGVGLTRVVRHLFYYYFNKNSIHKRNVVLLWGGERTRWYEPSSRPAGSLTSTKS